MSSQRRVYYLYPTPHGVSNRLNTYQGTSIVVAAKSIKQAYWVASHDKWIGEDRAAVTDTGIVYVAERDRAHRLCCGCSDSRVYLPNGAGDGAIAKAVRSHGCGVTEGIGR